MTRPGPKIIDLTKEPPFGRLTVLRQARRAHLNGPPRWLCRCACGKVTIVIGDNLRSGVTKSCGCLMRERVAAAQLKHGLTNHPLFSTWDNMIGRCYRSKRPDYVNYGGRGIRVCNQWHSAEIFIRDILSILGPKPAPEYSLDRKDNDRGYWPDNVRWATRVQQSNNRRRVQ